MQFRLEFHEVLESTSSLVKQRAEDGAAEGLAIQALRQSAGRGRQGRGWDSPAGNLYISVLLRPAVPLRDAPQWSFVAAVALAETLGSVAAGHVVAEGHTVVGLDINANHLKSARSGWVTGIARPVHIGRSTQVWHIDMCNDDGELTCVSRLTMAVLAPR